LRQLAIILFITLILGPSLSRTWILLDFKIHQGFIASVLCINRDEPTVMCNGTCYLTQQLAENEQREDTPFYGAEKFELIYALDQQECRKSSTTLAFSNIIPFHYREVSSNYLEEVFHPPAVFDV